jgi:hypothetical protein
MDALVVATRQTIRHRHRIEKAEADARVAVEHTFSNKSPASIAAQMQAGVATRVRIQRFQKMTDMEDRLEEASLLVSLLCRGTDAIVAMDHEERLHLDEQKHRKKRTTSQLKSRWKAKVKRRDKWQMRMKVKKAKMVTSPNTATVGKAASAR